MSYRRGTVPSINDSEEFNSFVVNELESVERAFRATDLIRLAKQTNPPTKLSEGLIAFADGTSWNPGSGAGIYAYYSGSWHKL